MRTTVRQDTDFHEALLPSKGSFLEDAIRWIKDNLDPEDVFSDEQLRLWATFNDYVKEGDSQ